jgi:hypothetical protein
MHKEQLQPETAGFDTILLLHEEQSQPGTAGIDSIRADKSRQMLQPQPVCDVVLCAGSEKSIR